MVHKTACTADISAQHGCSAGALLNLCIEILSGTPQTGYFHTAHSSQSVQNHTSPLPLNHRREATLILSYVLKKSIGQVELDIALDIHVQIDLCRKAVSASVMRARGIPIGYIFGYVNFCGLDISVGPGCFIPRFETELLVEHACRIISRFENPVIFDLCAGSGAIGLAVAALSAPAKVIFVEESSEAYAYLLKNISAYRDKSVAQVSLTPFCGDWEFVCRNLAREGMLPDFIIANPPYISMYGEVDCDVLEHEPHKALFSAETGMFELQRLIKYAAKGLKPGGTLILEHGCDQGRCVREYMRLHGFVDIATCRDLAQKERFTTGRCIIKEYAHNF